MSERGILFSAPMVRALLDGSKTQTRRAIKPDPGSNINPVRNNLIVWQWATVESRRRCPYGAEGDRLWVRETHWWFKDEVDHETGYFPPKLTSEDVQYRADCDDGRKVWRPSIFMPRWASRITLEITEVRVERLQDISRGDAMAEGCPFPNMAEGDNPRSWYRGLWESINGVDSWTANPWVWVIEFRAATEPPAALRED